MAPPSGSKSMVHYDKTGVFVRFEYASEEFPEDDSYVRGAVTITEQYVVIRMRFLLA